MSGTDRRSSWDVIGAPSAEEDGRRPVGLGTEPERRPPLIPLETGAARPMMNGTYRSVASWIPLRC